MKTYSGMPHISVELSRSSKLIENLIVKMESSTPMRKTLADIADIYGIDVGIRPTPEAAASSTVALDIRALYSLQHILTLNNVHTKAEDLVTLLFAACEPLDYGISQQRNQA